ncbi:MAG: glycosyltransferase family 4 protein [Bryobacterales bacterium]|nr:glycosyltransferase family 4 protein [Bryobacterales bacterium]
MNLGYFAPLPPQPSGVADYAAAMLRGLSRHGDVRVNASGHCNLYHIGNNRLHAEIYERAMAEPGVVLLHDAMLHHLLIGSFGETQYLEEFVYNYGAWTEDLARTLWRQRARAMSEPRYFRYPLLKRISEHALSLIVHSEEARRTVMAHDPNARVRVLPHLDLEQPDAAPDPSARERFRRETLGLRATDLLLGVYGHLRETKRIGSVLAALDALRGSGVPARLLVAGAFASDDYARVLLPRLEAHPGVILRGGTAEDEFRALLSAADVCINLKYPGAGECSGIAVRAMSLGVPLVVSESGGGNDYAPGTVAPIPTGPAETRALTETLAWLARDAKSRHALVRAAQLDCRVRRDPDRICAEVWQWIEDIHRGLAA